MWCLAHVTPRWSDAAGHGLGGWRKGGLLGAFPPCASRKDFSLKKDVRTGRILSWLRLCHTNSLNDLSRAKHQLSLYGFILGGCQPGKGAAISQRGDAKVDGEMGG